MDLDKLKTTDGLDLTGKRVLVRADLNVPAKNGVVTDATRLERVVPGLRDLAIVLEHGAQPVEDVGHLLGLGAQQLLAERQSLEKIALRLLERIQVLALEVLYQRDLGDLVVLDVLDDRRHFRQPGLDGGLIATLAGDDLEAALTAPDQDGLEDPFLGDGRHELGQVAHDLPGLVRVRVDLVDGQESADRRRSRRRESFHVVLVVAHADGGWQASSRHVR